MGYASLDANMRIKPADTDGLRWHAPDMPPFRLDGFPWFPADHVYRRLPLHADPALPDGVDQLAWCTAGGRIGFRTDSSRVVVKARLRGAADMVHMPATGQCGFDCLVGPAGARCFSGVTKYDLRQSEYTCTLFEQPGLPDGEADASAERKRPLQEIALHFPLYSGVHEVWIGLDAAARTLPPEPYAIADPILFYGTSITQGGCATRPGMAYTNQLSGMLDAACINLGFSGNGRGEPALAAHIASLKRLSMIVLDYEANAPGESLVDTLPRFVDILRASHPLMPILVVAKPPQANDRFQTDNLARRMRMCEFQRQYVSERRRAGDRNLHFLEGEHLLGPEGVDGTVDGVHPTDLGFRRMAEAMAPVIRQCLAVAATDAPMA